MVNTNIDIENKNVVKYTNVNVINVNEINFQETNVIVKDAAVVP